MTTKTLIAVVAMGSFAAHGESVSSTNETAAARGVEMPEASAFAFDVGADFRVRQEIMHNVPYEQYGMVGRPGVARMNTKNQIRFRPRVWAELKAGRCWRLYARLCDEFRDGVVQSTHTYTWPGEVIVDNLYLEGKGLFDGQLDLLVGRHDLYRFCGLEHLFVDGGCGDGSRALYSNMAALTWHVDEVSTLTLFGLINQDREWMRLGTHRSHDGTQLTGFGGNETEMDDWAFGAVWGSRVDFVDYQLVGIQKNTASFHRRGVKEPRRQVNLLGTKVVPHWTENFATPLEAYGQVGRNGEGDSLTGWMTYAGIDWRDRAKKTWRPFVESGLMIMSGDKDAQNEEGGHHAWDPMWYRGIDDSEMMLYGSTYGIGWWSNMYNFKTTLGYEIGPGHRLALMFGPMFAQQQDHCGGGKGYYKGFLSQLRYNFPLWSGPKDSGLERFQLFGDIVLEHFAPGDYYDTDKPAYYVRWQLTLKF